MKIKHILCTCLGDTLVTLVVRNPLANAGDIRDTGLISGSG